MRDAEATAQGMEEFLSANTTGTVLVEDRSV
jgi:hypothetical protein